MYIAINHKTIKMDLQEKSIKELKEIIVLPDIYGRRTIMEAKEILSEREQSVDELQENKVGNRFEQELLSLTTQQQKDIKDIKNYLLFFVVLTVIGLFAGIFLSFNQPT